MVNQKKTGLQNHHFSFYLYTKTTPKTAKRKERTKYVLLAASKAHEQLGERGHLLQQPSLSPPTRCNKRTNNTRAHKKTNNELITSLIP